MIEHTHPTVEHELIAKLPEQREAICPTPHIQRSKGFAFVEATRVWASHIVWIRHGHKYECVWSALPIWVPSRVAMAGVSTFGL